jgi:hypothetical protein
MGSYIAQREIARSGVFGQMFSAILALGFESLPMVAASHFAA